MADIRRYKKRLKNISRVTFPPEKYVFRSALKSVARVANLSLSLSLTFSQTDRRFCDTGENISEKSFMCVDRNAMDIGSG